MKELLSRIGIGAATVDTVLPKNSFRVGERFDARIDVEGGSVEQRVDDIYFMFVTMYKTEEGYATGVIERTKAADGFTIGASEKKSLPVTAQIPYHTPLTLGHTNVWLKTGLDVELAIDPSDRDTLRIEPDERLGALFEALETLGFHLHGGDCKQVMSGLAPSFVQELAFKPAGGTYAGKLNELELVCNSSENEVEVVMEIDARMGGVAGMLGGEHEQKRRFKFQEGNPEEIRQRVAELLPG